MVKAIARAFRWREMPENGTHATIAEIAAAERINESYVGRVLRLTLPAPNTAIRLCMSDPLIPPTVMARPSRGDNRSLTPAKAAPHRSC